MTNRLKTALTFAATAAIYMGLIAYVFASHNALAGENSPSTVTLQDGTRKTFADGVVPPDLVTTTKEYMLADELYGTGAKAARIYQDTRAILQEQASIAKQIMLESADAICRLGHYVGFRNLPPKASQVPCPTDD